jgi:SAM-dependent methyltransferase
MHWAPTLTPGGLVLDLAAGGGRHTHYLSGRGHPVIAVDRDIAALHSRSWPGNVEIIAADLENGSPWPLAGRRFAGIVVTNYLHRPLFPRLAASLERGGLLIYETFALGNERFGKPSNPAFLLRPGELLEVAESNDLTVLGYFSGEVTQPKPAVIQRLAARAVG